MAHNLLIPDGAALRWANWSLAPHWLLFWERIFALVVCDPRGAIAQSVRATDS